MITIIRVGLWMASTLCRMRDPVIRDHSDITLNKKIVLSKSEGYCQSRGQRFNYGATLYVLKILLRDQGLRTRVSMLCELAASGLPASYNCDKDVRNLNWKIARQKPPSNLQGQSYQLPANSPVGGSLWNYNGSTVKLTANGARRQFVYERPLSGEKAGRETRRRFV